MLDDIARLCLLNDFYGPLLTQRQQEVLRLYYEDNLSLSEIAGEFGISRQGVHDTLKSAGHALEDYESKLGLVSKMELTAEGLRELTELAAKIRKRYPEDAALAAELDRIRELAAVLGD